MHLHCALRTFPLFLLVAVGANRAEAQLKFDEHIYAEPGVSSATYIDRLKHGTTEWQRYNAAAALGELRDKSAIPALVEALGSPSEYVRENAVASLGDLDAVQAIPNVKKLLHDPAADARANAAYALAQLGAADSLADIQSLYNDVSPHVRAGAREAVEYLQAKKK